MGKNWNTIQIHGTVFSASSMIENRKKLFMTLRGRGN